MQKFLDDTGLAYFWDKVKARIDETSSGSGSGGIINWEDINNRPDLSTVSNMNAVQIALLADGWENNKQELPVVGVSEDVIKQLIIIVPDKDDSDNFYAAGITAVQGENAITFNAVNSPTEDIGLYIYIIESVETERITNNFEWWSPKMTSDTTPGPYKSSASASYPGNFQPWRAFDGDNSSCWHSQSKGSGYWLSFDFGKEEYVAGMRMFPRMGYPQQFVKSGNIQGSHDNDSWETITPFGEITIPSDSECAEVLFDNTVNYRYYRIADMVSNGDQFITIGEIEFYKLQEQEVAQ